MLLNVEVWRMIHKFSISDLLLIIPDQILADWMSNVEMFSRVESWGIFDDVILMNNVPVVEEREQPSFF